MDDVTKKRILDLSIFTFLLFVLQKPVGTGRIGNVESGLPGEGPESLRN